MSQNSIWQVTAAGILTTIVATAAPKIANVWEYKAIKDTGANIKSPDEVPLAKKQKEISDRNFDCIGFPQRYVDAGNMKYTALLCPDTGDILVQYKLIGQGAKGHSHWIEANERRSLNKDISLFSAPANASTGSTGSSFTRLSPSSNESLLSYQDFKTIFQKVVSQGNIVRITQKADGTCSRQMINSYSGDFTSVATGQCSFGYCTLLPKSNLLGKIVNDRCIIGRTGQNIRDLTWSSGKVMKVVLNPASVDGKPGRLIEKNSKGGTISVDSGNIGWCWDCKA